MRTIGIIVWLFLFGNMYGQGTDTSLRITRLTGDFYIFTTYHYYKGARVPANGMYVLTHKGVILLDSPWDTTQFQPLLDSIDLRHHAKVVLCMATHFHEDRTGGLEYYASKGINTYTTRQTDELSKAKGMKRARFLFMKDTVFSLGQYSFQAYYPGPGHAPDNIVVWFPKEKVLYGGCLIKSVGDKDLGNLADANIIQYAGTVRNVTKKCKEAAYIIPGHNDWTDTGSLQHTLEMAEKLKQGNYH